MNFLLKQLMLRHRLMEANDGAGNDLSGGGDDGKKDDGQKPGDDGQKPGDDGKKDDGQKKTSDEEARLLKENMKRKEDLRKAQQELDDLRKRFDGIDPEAVRKILAERAEAETKELERKGDYDRLKQRMAEEHTKEVQTLQQQIADLQAQLGKASGTISELTVGTQFGQSKFIADELTLTPGKARVVYGDYFDIVDGAVVGYDKPRGAANRTALVDQYGTPVAFDQALRKIVESDPDKDHLLKAKIRPGAGSDSKRATTDPGKLSEGADSVSKIANGLKGFKLA